MSIIFGLFLGTEKNKTVDCFLYFFIYISNIHFIFITSFYILKEFANKLNKYNSEAE